MQKKWFENSVLYYFSTNEAIDNTIDGIHYQKKPLTYPETVEIMKRSRCLLELKASKYDACTLRVQEAVVLGKRILTDNEKVKRMPCCDECDAVSVFDEIEAIDIELKKSNRKRTMNTMKSIRRLLF